MEERKKTKVMHLVVANEECRDQRKRLGSM